MVPKLDSYWQDTPHALRDLEEENKRGPQPANAILVTADVVGLYTNIPQEEGMEVFRQALNSSRFRPDPKLPTEFLMTLLFFVLIICLFAVNKFIIMLNFDDSHLTTSVIKDSIPA